VSYNSRYPGITAHRKAMSSFIGSDVRNPDVIALENEKEAPMGWGLRRVGRSGIEPLTSCVSRNDGRNRLPRQNRVSAGYHPISG
jgi:hypothetical protein